jgi:hypothetical protein
MSEGRDSRIDEFSRRRPDGFRDAPEAEPIVLCDSQAWLIPKPLVEFFPLAGGELGASATFGPDFDALVAAVDDTAAADPFDFRAHLRALFALGRDLLLRNYDLDNDALAALLRYRPGDDANRAMWGAILDVAAGNGPKASRGGGS